MAATLSRRLCRLPAPAATCLPRIACNRCVGARTLCAPAKPALPTQPSLPPQLTDRGLNPLHRALLFLWDPAEPALVGRVAAALALMISAKLMTIQVPFLFKDAIDLLAAPAAAHGLEAAQTTSYGPLLLTPAALMLAYGMARTSAEGMTQLRNALFARISEGALRRMSVRTFRHLHSMELRFHLSRQTGALSRTVERGTRAVGTLLSTSVLHVLPTIFEVGVVSALLARHCDPAVAAATLQPQPEPLPPNPNPNPSPRPWREAFAISTPGGSHDARDPRCIRRLHLRRHGAANANPQAAEPGGERRGAGGSRARYIP